MIISAGGNDFFKYPYVAILTGSEKLRARFKVSWILFRVGALAEEQQLAKHLMKIQQDGVISCGDVRNFSTSRRRKHRDCKELPPVPLQAPGSSHG